MIGWRGLVLLSLATLFGTLSCSQAAAPGKAATAAERRGPKLRLVGPAFRFRIAIYHPEAPALDVAATIRQVAATQGFTVLDAESENGPDDRSVVRFMTPVIERFPPPDAQALDYFSQGLEDGDKQAVLASKAVTALEFSGPGARAVEDYRRALSVTRDLTAKLGGYPMDEESRDIYTPDSFAYRAEAFSDGTPSVAHHVTLHLYRDGELMRIVSLGMAKFALPDVAVEDVANSSSASMGRLVHAVCQTLVEQGQVELRGILRVALDEIRETRAREAFTSDLPKGARRMVELELAPAEPEEGDSDNRLLAITFPGPQNELQQRHDEALVALFGADDSVVEVEHDKELLLASARARTKALALRERFAKGAPTGEMLQVKAPFAVPSGGNEWMWVEVVTWDGDVIHGILGNDPFHVPDLKSGARVDVKASEIFDYIWTKSDGKTEGNETSAILQKRTRPR